MKQLTGGKGVDVILDMVAGELRRRARSSAWPKTAASSIIAVQGGIKAEIDAGLVLRRRLDDHRLDAAAAAGGVQGGDRAGAAQDTVWPLLESGAIKPVIHQVFPAAEAAEAHALMESNQHIGKIVLTW